jgi:hypothetical protein
MSGQIEIPCVESGSEILPRFYLRGVPNLAVPSRIPSGRDSVETTRLYGQSTKDVAARKAEKARIKQIKEMTKNCLFISVELLQLIHDLEIECKESTRYD